MFEIMNKMFKYWTKCSYNEQNVRNDIQNVQNNEQNVRNDVQNNEQNVRNDEQKGQRYFHFSLEI